MREYYKPEPRQSSGLIRGAMLAVFIGAGMALLLVQQLSK